ncbi:MAG: hypothetical protein JXB23_17550 [Candidatus Aminicenantes bacterium]|nr:hypothetical protein [Candidatus Aminicenantes bacterium]
MISDEEALIIKHLEQAACEYGVVMDLLSVIERLQSGEKISEEDKRLFEIASLAAPLARYERKDNGKDQE